jgi:hypothetical protein
MVYCLHCRIYVFAFCLFIHHSHSLYPKMNLDPNHTTIEEFPLSEEGEACEEEKEEDKDEDEDTQDNNNEDEEVDQGSAEGPEPTMAKQKHGPRKKKGMLVVICVHTSCSLSFMLSPQRGFVHT